MSANATTLTTISASLSTSLPHSLTSTAGPSDRPIYGAESPHELALNSAYLNNRIPTIKYVLLIPRNSSDKKMNYSSCRVNRATRRGRGRRATASAFRKNRAGVQEEDLGAAAQKLQTITCLPEPK